MNWNDTPSHRAPPTFRLLKLRSQVAHEGRGTADCGEHRETAKPSLAAGQHRASLRVCAARLAGRA
jgi:hypothetical protein